jgi:hypothetical protein
LYYLWAESSVRPTIVAFVLNSILLLISFFIAGGGHGLMAPMVLLSGPSPVNVGLFLVAEPLYWIAVGYSVNHWKRSVFPIMVLLHYAGATAGLILDFRDDFADPYRNLHEILDYFMWWIILFCVVYLAEQIILWSWWIRRPA